MSLTDLLPTGNGSESASVRKPAFSVNSRSSSGGGGLLGSLDVPLLSSGSSDPWQQALVSIRTRSSMAPAVAYTQVNLSDDSQGPTVALDDALQVSLGYGSETSVCASGTVGEVVHRINGERTLVLHSAAAKLTALRVNQSYEQQAAGDIVNDLLSQAEVTAGTIESGADLPFYVVDEHCHAWEVIEKLATLSGYVAYCDRDDAVNFKPLQSDSPVASFDYGVSVLSCSIREASPVLEELSVTGDSASGSEGADAAYWIVKDPSGVSTGSGSGSKKRLAYEPALKDAQSVESAASGAVTRAATMANSGSVTLLGDAAVDVGTFITINNAPDAFLNGDYWVTSVEHCFNKKSGYTTRCEVAKFAEGGGAGGGLLGGLL